MTSISFLTKFDQILIEFKVRIIFKQLKAYEAFCLLFFDDKIKTFMRQQVAQQFISFIL